MDEVLQRALKELERSGQQLVTRPTPALIRLLRETAARAVIANPGLAVSLNDWLKENDLQSTGCVICDEDTPDNPAPPHGCVGYLGPTGVEHLTGHPGPTGVQGAPAPVPHIHPSQAFPAQPKKQPVIRTFADQRYAKPQQQHKPRLRRRP